MSQKLRVGVIGAGAIGKVHCDAYLGTGQAELHAMCDVNAERLAAEADKRGVKHRFTDYRQLLATDVDAVSVCVGNALHRDVAVAASRAGKHVLVEKPMALNAAQATDIMLAGQQAGKVVQVGMVWRQNPTAQLLREYVQAGVLGDIYHIRCHMVRRRGIPGMGGWFTTKSASGGGPMIDLGVHWFDVSMWMSGLWNPTRVSGRTYAKFGPKMREYRYVGMWAGPPNFDGVFDVEDFSTGLVRFGDKATLEFMITWACNAQDEAYIELLGDKGGARVFDGKPMTLLTEHNDRLADIQPKFDEKSDNFKKQAAAFLAACRGEAPPAATALEGVTIMKLIDSIYASSELGREIEIP